MQTLTLIFRNRLAGFGMVLLVSIALLALCVPWLGLPDPDITATGDRFMRPLSEGHLLGTDHLGRDLLSRLLWGTRLSLAVGITAALIAGLIGGAIGVLAGYFGGRVDTLLMRGVDMLMAFPYILLALAIVAAMGPGLINALIAVAAVNIPFFARNIRGATASLAGRDFVDAARLTGKGHTGILLGEILPNLWPTLVVAMSTTVGWMILETAGLSFLGLGSQPPQADLGSMLGEARAAIITAPHTSVVPGMMIFAIVMAVNLFGDGVRDALDPRLRAGALTRPGPATLVDRERRQPAPEASSGALLDVAGLQSGFERDGRRLRAVNGVDLQLAPGECLGLVGESGSGKSVTALSLARLVASPPGVIEGGSVRFDGEDLLAASIERLRALRGGRVAYIFQDPLSTLHPQIRIGDQLVEAVRCHQSLDRAAARERARSLLDAVQIPNPEARLDAWPHELSGGMRQRVCIAMALANEPSLIIADEPTTALDVTVQAQILALLDRLRRERGLALLFITHDFGVVSQLCDRAAVLYAGEVVEEGDARVLLTDPVHPYTRRLIDCVPRAGDGRALLAAIPGLPPAIGEERVGCAFAPRCDRASDRCRASAPTLVWRAGRAFRCHHPEGELA